MLTFITNIVAIAKGIESLRKLGDLFNMYWIKYDLDKIGDQAEAKIQEFDALNAAMKRTTNDTERLALLRSIDRLK